MAMRGYTLPLPHEVAARQINEVSFVQSVLASAVEQLETLEKHMQTCHAEHHFQKRCELLEVVAEAGVRLEELYSVLDIGEN